MPFTDPNIRQNLEKLLDVTTTLADFTTSPDIAVQLPAHLSRILDLKPITLAIVRTGELDSNAEVILLGTSGDFSTDDPGFHRTIIDIHRHTRPAKENPGLRLSAPSEDGFSQVDVPSIEIFSKAVVFARTLDHTHRMLLVVHRTVETPTLARSIAEPLNLIVAQLTKLVRCMLLSQSAPEVLGAAFDRLTDREWVVLRSLNSEDGEKQLADRLGLSPHTLHSHIKSIYRKVGVQGRLPLLLRLNAALRDLRASSLNAPPIPHEHAPRRSAVAYVG